MMQTLKTNDGGAQNEASVRSLFDAAASSAQSWPEDNGHENGNYECECASCGTRFYGHKRRVTCKVCHTEAMARWEAMTPQEREESTARTARELAALFAQNGAR